MNSTDQPNHSRENERPQQKSKGTMHDHVETWTDTCSCEPEPRWQAVEEELEERAREETGRNQA